jgi:hypothetical protein
VGGAGALLERDAGGVQNASLTKGGRHELSSNPGSDIDGAAADGRAYTDRFSGPYSHRVRDGKGYHPQHEAPWAFADAVLDVGGGMTGT